MRGASAQPTCVRCVMWGHLQKPAGQVGTYAVNVCTVLANFGCLCAANRGVGRLTGNSSLGHAVNT